MNRRAKGKQRKIQKGKEMEKGKEMIERERQKKKEERAKKLYSPFGPKGQSLFFYRSAASASQELSALA